MNMALQTAVAINFEGRRGNGEVHGYVRSGTLQTNVTIARMSRKKWRQWRRWFLKHW